jgi:FMN reductase
MMRTMQVVILSCSLNEDSRSAQLARETEAELSRRGTATDRLDLRDWPLPICDGEETYGDSRVQALSARLKPATGIVLAVPVYNFSANAAAKNVIELTGPVWEHKTVAFLCAAGGKGSYMSVMSLANSLMLDFHCLIVPHIVYATRHDFEEDQTLSQPVQECVRLVCQAMQRLAPAWHEAR